MGWRAGLKGMRTFNPDLRMPDRCRIKPPNGREIQRPGDGIPLLHAIVEVGREKNGLRCQPQQVRFHESRVRRVGPCLRYRTPWLIAGYATSVISHD